MRVDVDPRGLFNLVRLPDVAQRTIIDAPDRSGVAAALHRDLIRLFGSRHPVAAARAVDKLDRVGQRRQLIEELEHGIEVYAAVAERPPSPPV